MKFSIDRVPRKLWGKFQMLASSTSTEPVLYMKIKWSGL